MRITDKMQQFFHNCIKNNDKIYLFGSRAVDDKKGGDIDVFILFNNKYSFDELAKIQIETFA
ncbi:MAG: hypothetical protein DRQ51_02245 [Gammaproteobacteria bacterium]|nr:MAG: hypothetical protein DRQ51_02245 [Gammaproteobacteria bacterium]